MRKQKKYKHILSILLLFVLFGSLGGCIPSGSERGLEDDLIFSSFLDIPGITSEEIQSIRSLQEQFDYFTYGVPLSTEAFLTEEGEMEGFAALLCEWLSEFFEIEFRPVQIEFADLLQALESGEIDFAGGLAPTQERREIYHMTDPIIERSLKYFRLAGSSPLEEIQARRPLRFGFLEGSATTDLAISLLDEKEYEAIFVSYNEEAIELLKREEIDAYIHQNTTRIVFLDEPSIITENFLPPAFVPVSFTAKRDELYPIISIFQKALTEAQLKFLVDLYNLGDHAFTRYQLFSQFTDAELAYINGHPVIPLAAIGSNYPLSFFNVYENEWQGISHDILQQVASVLGVTFEIVGDDQMTSEQTIALLVSHEAAMITGLTREESEDGFLLSTEAILMDQPMLISGLEHPYIEFNEVLYSKIGVVAESIYSDLFFRWFPYASNVIYYPNMAAAFDGLAIGEVEVIMSSGAALLHVTHYEESPDYKANLVFDYYILSYFGFHPEEEMLREIIDHTLQVVGTDEIITQWLSRTFDYRVKIAEAQMPWMIGVGILMIFVLTLVIILLVRKQWENKKLWHFQNAELTIIADLIESRDLTTGKHITNTQKYLKCLIDKCQEEGLYKDEVSKWRMDELLLSAKLHDVGKISVSDAILNKPGKLTDEEYEIMKSHAQSGIDIITHMESYIEDSRFLVHAKRFAGSHHEKWDGSGYPYGLVGEDIPLEGRLLAIADMYDALVSERPYKKAFAPEEAAKIIQEGSGTVFDPTLVKIFEMVEEDFAHIERDT